LDIEAEILGFMVGIALFDIGDGIGVDLAVGVKNLKQGLAAIIGVGVEQVLGPDFVGCEAL